MQISQKSGLYASRKGKFTTYLKLQYGCLTKSPRSTRSIALVSLRSLLKFEEEKAHGRVNISKLDLGMVEEREGR